MGENVYSKRIEQTKSSLMVLWYDGESSTQAQFTLFYFVPT